MAVEEAVFISRLFDCSKVASSLLACLLGIDFSASDASMELWFPLMTFRYAPCKYGVFVQKRNRM